VLTRRDHASAIGRRRAALARHPCGEKRAEEWCELLVPIEEPQPQTPAEVAVALNPAWARVVVLRPHLDPPLGRAHSGGNAVSRWAGVWRQVQNLQQNSRLFLPRSRPNISSYPTT
jgi:hypothetical protein